MKRTFIAVFIFGLIITSCSSKSLMHQNSDALFRSKIVGSWSEGESPYSIATFENNGEYLARICEIAEKLKPILVIEGKWWIENGRLYNTSHKVEPPLFPPSDIPSIDVIVSISDAEMKLIDEQGKQYTKNKIK